MNRTEFNNLKKTYIAAYPQLAKFKYGNADRAFAQNAVILAAPHSVSPVMLWQLAGVANGQPIEDDYPVLEKVEFNVLEVK